MFEDCNGNAADALKALTPLSHNKARLDALEQDMFKPLVIALTPDEENHEALAMDVMVTAIYADFAARRAGILTGATPASPPREKKQADRSLFYWVDATPGLVRWMSDTLRKKHLARSFEQQWTVIRNADCAAYPVPNCAERLDDALRRMFDQIEK